MDWYREHVLDAGRSGALWLLVAFVVTYAATRWVTTSIRRRAARAEETGDARGRRTPIQDVHIGGVHVHHQVWGILLVLLSGMLVIRFDPDTPLLEVASVVFGAGAALALDEFALWLHLEDVYWSEQGRKSIDAVMVAGVVVLVVMVGTSPIGIDPSVEDVWWAVVFSLTLHLTLVVVTALKGKVVTAMIGLPSPFFSFVGSIRLAQPDSFWARRFYRDRPAKLERAQARMDRVLARRERLRDVLSGGRPGRS
ncbi:hypothetical protein JQN72_17955 [Phycicoccus sp. CSK15P-2]|uniref:hypothetical protein n=1 Tax=Phycicoccus sp. CSK15P-2 TaxID=2807627 RepID=UPI00194F2A17|nr:hypothetical protein [Phycicoccus sp. CSK15P-2]MBM6406121.1 hypothetical protein [Phycicoccus sp. CSK15P-2]